MEDGDLSPLLLVTGGQNNARDSLDAMRSATRPTQKSRRLFWAVESGRLKGVQRVLRL